MSVQLRPAVLRLVYTWSCHASHVLHQTLCASEPELSTAGCLRTPLIRLTKARTCPTELDDDMVAAALEACTMHAPVHAPPAPALAEAVLPPALGMLGRASSQGEGFALRRAESHAPALWQQLNSAQRGYSSGGSSSRGSGCASRASSMRVPSTQEQLFAARADAAQSHAQVQCLQDALAKVGA